MELISRRRSCLSSSFLQDPIYLYTHPPPWSGHSHVDFALLAPWCSIPHPTRIPSIQPNPLIPPRCYIHLRWRFSMLFSVGCFLLLDHNSSAELSLGLVYYLHQPCNLYIKVGTTKPLLKCSHGCELNHQCLI